MRLASRGTTMLVGLVVVLSLVTAVYLSLTVSTGLPGQSFRTASADFVNVGGLRTGDDVRRASVRVGQVRAITYEDGQARVVMQLDPDSRVYRDAAAAVVARSALGQNFVLLDPGHEKAGELPEGGALKDSATVAPVNLDEVLSVLDEPTRVSTGGLVRQLGRGAAGHSQDLGDALSSAPGLLSDLQVLARAAAAPETGLDAMITTSQRLASRFDGRTDQIGRLVDSLRTTTEAVTVDGAAPLGRTLQEAPAALDSTRTAMTSLRGPLRDLDTTMRTVTPGAQALGSSTPDLRAALRDAVIPLGKVPAVATAADPAVQSLSALMVDARPLADRLEKTFASLDAPTAVLAPYAPEISRFFGSWANANRFRDKSGHYLRIDLVVRPESVIGLTGVPDPIVHRNPYPAPGVAEGERATTLLGNR